MADYFWGEITIPLALIDQEVEAAIEAEIDGDSNIDKYDGLYFFGNPNARYGEFPDLEELLIDKGIPFDRNSEAKYEFEAEIRKYRPPVGKSGGCDVFLSTNNNGHPVVYADDVRMYALKSDLSGLLKYLDKQSPVVQDLSDWIKENLTLAVSNIG
jgi:hypothetical protein